MDFLRKWKKITESLEFLRKMNNFVHGEKRDTREHFFVRVLGEENERIICELFVFETAASQQKELAFR